MLPPAVNKVCDVGLSVASPNHKDGISPLTSDDEKKGQEKVEDSLLGMMAVQEHNEVDGILGQSSLNLANFYKELQGYKLEENFSGFCTK
jgi:hypothetical protein